MPVNSPRSNTDNVQERNAAAGWQTSRAETASGNNPLATTNIFVVTGGRILLRGLVAQITTAVQATATTVKFTSAPATGTATDLSGSTTDLTGAEIGSLYGLASAGPGTSNQVQHVKSGYLVLPSTQLAVVPPGTVSVTYGGTAATGAAKYDILYSALDAGARVTPVA
jgi:hypothetical protein